MEFIIGFVCRYLTEKVPATKDITEALQTLHYPSATATSEQIEAMLFANFSSQMELVRKVDNEYTLYNMALVQLGISPGPAPTRLNKDGTDAKKPFPCSTPVMWFCCEVLQAYARMSGAKITPRKCVEMMANAAALTERALSSTKLVPTELEVSAENATKPSARVSIGQFIVLYKQAINYLAAMNQLPAPQTPQSYGAYPSSHRGAHW